MEAASMENAKCDDFPPFENAKLYILFVKYLYKNHDQIFQKSNKL